MRREFHVRFCEGPGVRFPRATRLHVFGLEWEAGEIRWYLDGAHWQTQTEWHTAGSPSPAPFDRSFHLLLNLAVGGNWPGAPDETTVFPQQLRVDWVRVWRR